MNKSLDHLDQSGTSFFQEETPQNTVEVGQDSTSTEGRGKLAEFWAFRFTGSKIPTQGALKNALEQIWIIEYGYQEEKGEFRGTLHYQGCLRVEPRKRFTTLQKHFNSYFPELIFDGRDYLEPSKSEAANKYGLKEKTRVNGPWFKGEKFEKIAEETVFKIDIILRPWQRKIIPILNAKPDDRDIWWFWEPYGGLGKTVFQKWIYQEYEGVIILGGKADNMKNGVVRYKEAKGEYPKIVLINLPKTFEHKYFSATGVEEVKDMFFFSGKYGSKEEKEAMVFGRPPTILIFSNEEPRCMEELAADRWIIVRLPDGKAKLTDKVRKQDWSDDNTGPIDKFTGATPLERQTPPRPAGPSIMPPAVIIF